MTRSPLHIQRTLPEQRYRYPYIGQPRFDRAGRPLAQRAFAAPPASTQWTEDDQMAALSRGYFIERSTGAEWGSRITSHYGADNHARVMPMVNSCYTSDAQVMDAVEAAAFRRDPHATKLLIFIEQQDSYGYSGAWEKSVERLTSTLTWYKDRHAVQRKATRALSDYGRLMALKRWGKIPEGMK